jgi:WD40 repeat protein
MSICDPEESPVLALKTSKQKEVTRFAFSGDGKYLAVAGSGKKVHLWDVTAKKLRAKVVVTFKDTVEWLGWLPDGKLFMLSLMGQYATHDPAAGATDEAALIRGWVGPVVAAADRSAFYGTNWKAMKWSFDGQLRMEWWRPVPDGHSGRGGAVLTPDGEYLAAMMNGGVHTYLHTRIAATGEFRGEQVLAKSLVRDLTLLPDGRTLVFVRTQEYMGPTPNALVTGVPGGKFEVLHAGPDGAHFRSLALHPSGKWLAAGQFDGTVRVFDVTNWREVVAYQWPVQPIEGLAFAPNGQTAAAGGADGKFVVWDVDL